MNPGSRIFAGQQRADHYRFFAVQPRWRLNYRARKSSLMWRAELLELLRPCLARMSWPPPGGVRSLAGNDGAAISHRVTRDRIGVGDAIQVARGGLTVGREGSPVRGPGDRPLVPGRVA